MNPATERQLQGLLGQDISDQPKSARVELREPVNVGLIFVVIGSTVGLLLLIYGAYRYVYPSVRYAADERGRFYFTMRRLSRKLERRGISDPKRVGWLAWSVDVKNRIDSDGKHRNHMKHRKHRKQVDDMVGLLLRLTYGGEAFHSSYSSRMKPFRKLIKKGILQKKSS